MTDLLLLLLMAGLAAGLVVPRLMGKRKVKTPSSPGPAKSGPGANTAYSPRMPVTSSGDPLNGHKNPAAKAGPPQPVCSAGAEPLRQRPAATQPSPDQPSPGEHPILRRGPAAPTPFGGNAERQRSSAILSAEGHPTVYLTTPSPFVLEVTAGPDGGQKYMLMNGVNHVGRAPGSQARLSDPTVSGQHAIIELGTAGATLYDDASTNGTFLNGQQVLEPRALKVGDQVTLGRSTVVLRT